MLSMHMRTASITSLILIALALPLLTSAHVLKTDGTIGVVIHLAPDDAPLAGAPTPIYFAFKNTEGAFDIATCECALWVSSYAERNSVDLAQPDSIIHTHGNPASADASYVFPRPDIYAVRIIGTPRDGAAFEKFDVTFDVRVAEYAEGGGAPFWGGILAGHGLHIAIFALGFLFFLGAVLYDRYRERSSIQ
jgi:hypothetical protein